MACEMCGVGLRYHGGSHLPRWCDEHRAAGQLEAHRMQERERRRRDTADGVEVTGKEWPASVAGVQFEPVAGAVRFRKPREQPREFETSDVLLLARSAPPDLQQILTAAVHEAERQRHVLGKSR